MGSATRILRMALHAFLSPHHPAASAAALLALPFSAAALLSRSPPALPPSLLPALSRRLRHVFLAAGFPPASSQLLFLLNHRLSHSILSSLATFPFAMTSLLLAKSLAVHAVLLPPRPRRRGGATSWRAMARTQVACYGAMLLAHAAVFAAMLAAFTAAEAVGFGSDSSSSSGGGGGRAALAMSAAGVIIYSVALANAAAVCNLATVVVAADSGNGGGFHAILKAILLVRGDAATAVAVALPATLATAAVEGLFQLRVARPYVAGGGGVTSSMAFEGILIAYIHSMICVLDTVITCMVYKTCKMSISSSDDDLFELEDKGDLAA